MTPHGEAIEVVSITFELVLYVNVHINLIDLIISCSMLCYACSIDSVIIIFDCDDVWWRSQGFC